jgi:hypothetical protein
MAARIETESIARALIVDRAHPDYVPAAADKPATTSRDEAPRRESQGKRQIRETPQECREYRQ